MSNTDNICWQKVRSGSKIKFHEEKQKYVVRCRNERYLICTKPMNALKTFLYTIVDLEENIRGTENFIFCLGYTTDEECCNALERLSLVKSEISSRNNIPLKVDNIKSSFSKDCVDGPYKYEN